MEEGEAAEVELLAKRDVSVFAQPGVEFGAGMAPLVVAGFELLLAPVVDEVLATPLALLAGRVLEVLPNVDGFVVTLVSDALPVVATAEDSEGVELAVLPYVPAG